LSSSDAFSFSNLSKRKTRRSWVRTCQTIIGPASGCPVCLGLSNAHTVMHKALLITCSHSLLHSVQIPDHLTFRSMARPITFSCQETNVLQTFIF
jgi:hypothetical protein